MGIKSGLEHLSSYSHDKVKTSGDHQTTRTKLTLAIAIVKLMVKYPGDFKKHEYSSVCKTLRVMPDISNKQVNELTVIAELLDTQEEKDEFITALNSIVEATPTWDWILIMPLIHFLTKDATPFCKDDIPVSNK